MSDPNLPEGVTQRDIDRHAEGSSEHECTCDGSCVDELNELKEQNENFKNRISAIKEILLKSAHPVGCDGWSTRKDHSVIFNDWNCGCAFSDCLHEIEMMEGLL